MKKSIIIIVFILTLFIFSSCSGSQSENESLLVEMTEGIGAEFVKMDISYGGKLNDSFIQIEEINIIGEKLKSEIGILGEKEEENNNYSEEIITEDNFNQYTICGNNETGDDITIIVTSYVDEETEIEETTVFVDIVLNTKYVKIAQMVEEKREILKQNGIEAEITTCIVGSFSGKLNSDEINDKITMTINKINGKIIEDYHDNNLISVSAYTSLIDNHIFIGNRKMNLNVAMRYNEYEDATYIWIGTPIIAIGY